MKRTIFAVFPGTLIETRTLECVFYKKYSGCCDMAKVLCILCTGSSVSGLAKKVAGHQGLQLQKVVGPDEKL